MRARGTFQVVKVLGKTLLFAAALYALFRFAGDFSSNQSIVLAVVAWVGYGLYEKLSLSRKSEDAFTPYCVSVYPHWYRLLQDLKLIRSDDDWKKLTETSEKAASPSNVLRQGFTFSVIRPPGENGLLPGLTYWNNERWFLTELELKQSVIELDEESKWARFGEKHKYFDHPAFSSLPRFVLRYGAKGYEIGLEVHDDWWRQLCKSGEVGVLAKSESSTNPLTGTTRVTIATVPYTEFGFYYRSVDYIENPKVREEMDKQLATYGWKRNDNRNPEVSDPWFRIEHKYCSISHRGV
jgi:hypothetical protein